MYVVSDEMERGYSNPITVGTILGTVTPGPWASLSRQSGMDIILASIHEDSGLTIVKNSRPRKSKFSVHLES